MKVALRSIIIIIIIIIKCTYLSDTVMRNAAGTLYTVNNGHTISLAIDTSDLLC